MPGLNAVSNYSILSKLRFRPDFSPISCHMKESVNHWPYQPGWRLHPQMFILKWLAASLLVRFPRGPTPVGICDSAKANFIFQHHLSRETIFSGCCWGLVYQSWQVFYDCWASSSALGVGLDWLSANYVGQASQTPSIYQRLDLVFVHRLDGSHRFQESASLWFSQLPHQIRLIFVSNPFMLAN